ncbi:hypothetical protein [uncultured Caulobacter sp.]|jgi:hypothetical protein|uniref:hypothetical protein n=1 Tax=uncultured Caulobacter sp. TaxID=158749 RepID=UPI0026153449|nr:hypothetical protein [uncultured Caulobacter sp.]
MAISGDYPRPVTVNGFSCKNCTDVDYAKKHIDPAHPKDGPYGVNAKDHRHDKGVGGGNAPTDAASRRIKSWADPGVRVDVFV